MKLLKNLLQKGSDPSGTLRISLVFTIMMLTSVVSLWAEPASSSRVVIVADMEGLVEVLKSGSEDWQAAESDMKLYEKDELRVAEDGFALLWVDEGARTGNVEVEPGSHLRISTLELDEVTGEKKTYLDLALGKVLVRAEELIGDSKFEVRTPSASAGVRGTIFEVSVEEE